MVLTRSQVEDAKSGSPWDFGNNVLYALCRENPSHCEKSIVIAKIWLIGRAYAAAIERRRNIEISDKNFYIDRVSPKIISSDIDKWLGEISAIDKPSEYSLPQLIFTHAKVTQLFGEISGLEKRSLASKYLHFHKPNLFYIYDSRAVDGMRKISNILRHGKYMNIQGDNEYSKFAQKCLRLQNYIASEYSIFLKPRELDNLLLEISAT